MLIAFAGRPPPSTSSRRGSPLESRSLIATSRLARRGALPEQVLHGRDELQRIERLLEEGVRARRERLVTRLERGDRQARRDSALLQTPAQLGAGPAGDEQLDHRELRRALLELARGVIGIEGDERPRSPRSEGRTRRTPPRTGSRSASRIRSSAPRWLDPSRPKSLPALRAARPAGDGPPPRCSPLVDPLPDEPELLDLCARVEPVAAIAALGLDEPVTLLPVPESSPPGCRACARRR